MSFKAHLKVDGGEEVRLLHCSFTLGRDVDPTGRPSSNVRGGTISFQIESTDDVSLMEWMVDPFKMKGGGVTFYKRDSNTKMKELKWKDGYIINYNEDFEAVGENPMTIRFVVSAREITLGTADFKNEWPKA